MSNKIVYWIAYAMVLATGLYALAVKGALTALWTHDTYYLTTVVVFVWALTEATLAICWFTLMNDGLLDWDRVGKGLQAAEVGSDFLQGIAVASTLVGLVLAFWPFLGIVDLEMIRGRIGDLISGVAVAFVPSAVAFVAVVCIEINKTLLERAV
jgi:hypothetical protein